MGSIGYKGFKRYLSLPSVAILFHFVELFIWDPGTGNGPINKRKDEKVYYNG